MMAGRIKTKARKNGFDRMLMMGDRFMILIQPTESFHGE